MTAEQAIILLTIHNGSTVMNFDNLDENLGFLYKNEYLESSGLEVTYWCSNAHMATEKGNQFIKDILALI